MKKIDTIRLGGSNWYARHDICQYIHQEAGVKENILGGMLSAIIFVLSGYSIKAASSKTNIPEKDIEQALQDESAINYARLQMKHLEELMDESPEPLPSLPPVDSFLEEAFKYIGGHEGIRLEVYNDTEGHPTIGIGHKIKKGEDFSQGITMEEAKALFAEDIQERLAVTKGLFPQFDSYPDYVKLALLDGVFRGDHRRAYRTTKLINRGDWTEASKEYLRNNDYYKSQRDGTGIASRMEDNAERMAQYGKMEQV